MATVKVIAHRGWSEAAPENTLPAYQMAGEHPCFWGCECDIHETKDGRLVLLHDETLDDTTNAGEIFGDRRREDGHIWVTDLTLEEIKTLRIKDREVNPPGYRNVEKFGEVTVPTLEEYLDVCAATGKMPVIEVKEMDFPERYLDILKSRGIVHNVLMLSFNKNALRSIINIEPKINMQLLFEEDRLITGGDLSEAYELGCCAVDVHYGSVTRQMVESAHNVGLRVGAWEAKKDVSIEEIKRVIDCGVDYITVDKPFVLD